MNEARIKVCVLHDDEQLTPTAASASAAARYQARQLLQTHQYGVVKYVRWHQSKALPWCPADTQDSVRTVRVA